MPWRPSVALTRINGLSYVWMCCMKSDYETNKKNQPTITVVQHQHPHSGIAMSMQSRLLFTTTIALLSGLTFSILGILPSLGWRVTLQDTPSHQTASQLFRDSYYQHGPPEHGVVIHGDHYLGKAFILSTDGTLHSDIVFAAKQCGFYPFLLDAVQPNADRYPDYSEFLDFCFGGQNVTSATGMSAGEIALVGSHRLAMDRIAEDPDLRDDDWSIILESDARLSPDAVGQARSLVGSAIEQQKRNTGGYGFMYLGACAPTCEKIDGFVGQKCIGFCTHALALTKQRAKTFFRELYCSAWRDGEEASCGWACRGNDCIIDQVMRQFLREPRAPSIPLVGYDFISPDDLSHRGLLYQCCRTKATKSIGTSLQSIGFSPMPSIASHGPRCFRTEFTGRLGNLMFQYAALVGACVQVGLQPETCAGFSMRDLDSDDFMLPTKLLHDVFAIPLVSCPINASMTYREHADSTNAIKYDTRVLEQPVGTSFQGYLQSYKYFHHAQNDIRRLYRFSNDVALQTRRFFADIRIQSQSAFDPEDSEIACIHIRRGDKTRRGEGSPSNHWSLSAEYYQRALDILRQKKRSLIYVFLIGGGTDPKMVAEDRQWVSDTFLAPRPGQPSFLEPDNFAEANSLHMMKECDHLVVSASSFSWWAGYLSTKAQSIVAPKKNQDDSVPEDYYPLSWTLLDLQKLK